MKRLAFAIVIAAWSSLGNADVEVACEYVASATAKKTKILFTLPEPLRFGQLVPVEIKPVDGSSASMNTVVLKDRPYLVLADVYRIETNNSRIALIKISPDRSRLEVAYVNMGDAQGAKFYEGICRRNGGVL